MKKSIFLLVLGSLVVFSACKKDEDDDHSHTDATDTSAPVITISSPTAMKMYNNGDTVRIQGMVTDESLHELLIQIIKDADGSVMYEFAPTVHDLTSYTIDTYWKSSVSDHTNATVKVSAEDHSAHVASDSVKIHIMP